MDPLPPSERVTGDCLCGQEGPVVPNLKGMWILRDITTILDMFRSTFRRNTAQTNRRFTKDGKKQHHHYPTRWIFCSIQVPCCTCKSSTQSIQPNKDDPTVSGFSWVHRVCVRVLRRFPSLSEEASVRFRDGEVSETEIMTLFTTLRVRTPPFPQTTAQQVTLDR